MKLYWISTDRGTAILRDVDVEFLHHGQAGDTYVTSALTTEWPKGYRLCIRPESDIKLDKAECIQLALKACVSNLNYYMREIEHQQVLQQQIKAL